MTAKSLIGGLFRGHALVFNKKNAQRCHTARGCSLSGYMKLLILGATGHIGRELVDLALARGHLVTAYVRTPKKLARRDRGLTITQGDALEVDRLTEALRGQDAVVSALGLPARQAPASHSIKLKPITDEPVADFTIEFDAPGRPGGGDAKISVGRSHPFAAR